MLPRDLNAARFSGYPPQAKTLVVSHLDAIRQLPLAFLPSLLRRLLEYDYSFPVERSALDRELEILTSLPAAEHRDWFADFAAISLSPSLENSDWIDLPAQFVEQQSAYLWSTHQLDAFRKAALDYGDRLAKRTSPQALPMQRLGIAVVGQGVIASDGPKFRYLRKHGTTFTQVNPEGALQALLNEIERRAGRYSTPYAHWYVDGGTPLTFTSGITGVSYEQLGAVRHSLLKKIQAEIARPGMGPEELRTLLARMVPSDLGMEDTADPVLSRFQLKLFTEASGTQIYSTTFCQWSSREILRRAEAITLLVRYAPRQRQRPMNELLSGKQSAAELDPAGSLMDADMGAYYQWIDQQRLPGAEQSAFIAWFEGHGEAVAIGPGLPHGAESHSSIDVGKLLSLAAS